MNNINHRVKMPGRAWLIALIGFTLLTLNSVFLQVRTATHYNDTTDFSAYYAAARLKAVQADGIYSYDDLYKHSADKVRGNIRHYLYPPWFAEILSTLGGVDYQSFRIGWILVSHIFLAGLFVVTLFLCQRLTGRLDVADSLLCLAGFALFSPIERELFYGQVSLLLALLIYLAVVLYPYKRDAISGVLIGAAAMIKIYPAALMAWFLVNRRYKTLLGFCLFVIMVTGASVYQFGTEDWFGFFNLHFSNELIERVDSNGLSPSQFMNVPNYGLSHIIYISVLAMGGQADPAAAMWQGRLLVAGSVLLFLFYLRKTLWSERNSFEALVALIIWMMLISPVLWNHVFIFLLPAIVTYLVLATKTDDSLPGLALLLPASFFISMADYTTNLNILNDSALVLLKPVKLYSLLALLVFVSRRIRVKTTLKFVKPNDQS